MTSTHTGNPVCAAAVLANLRVIEEEGLVEHARQMGEILHAGAAAASAGVSQPAVGAVHGRGLVAALHIVKPGGIEPDAATASAIVRPLRREGALMLFAPVGYGGASVKIAPPLIISGRARCATASAALEEAIEEVLQ